MESIIRAVFDTNVLRAALWSSTGASIQVMRQLPHRRVVVLLSVPLYCEYEDVLTRPEQLNWGSNAPSFAEIVEFLRFFAQISEETKIYYLWRPWLKDRDDDKVLEVAVAGGATHLVTFNSRDFTGVEEAFGIQVVTPAEFLRCLRAAP